MYRAVPKQSCLADAVFALVAAHLKSHKVV